MHLFQKVGNQPVFSLPDSLIQVVTKFILLAAVLGLMCVGLGGYAYFQIFNHIVPGVTAGRTNLGAQSIYNAAVWLHKDWNIDRRITVGMLANGEILSEFIAPSDLGLSIDALETAQTAFEIGHNQSYLDNTEQFARSLFYGWEIIPQVYYDPDQARIGLEKIAKQFVIPPREATLQWDGVNLTALPGVPGYTLDLESSLKTLGNNPEQVMFEKLLPLTTQIIYPQISDASVAKAEVERWLNSPITLSAYDPVNDESIKWIVLAETMRAWLKIEDGLNFTLNQDLVTKYISTLSGTLGAGRFLDIPAEIQSIMTGIRQGNLNTLIIQHDPTSYTVQPGETLLRIGWKVGIPYWKITQSNPGLNPDKLKVGQVLIIPSKDDLLPLPIILNKRIIISISQQRLRTYLDGMLRTESVISTGIDRSPTQPGIFQVQTHELNAYASVWDLYMPHFLGIYEAWPGFMNGIHGLPTLSNGTRLWESILGKPASFGCIILNLQSAEDLYNWAENGVVVEIIP